MFTKNNLKKIIFKISPSGTVWISCRSIMKFFSKYISYYKIFTHHSRVMQCKQLLLADKRANPNKKTMLLITNQILDPTSFKVTYGGGERYLSELLSLFSELGFLVSILQANSVSSLGIHTFSGSRVLCVPADLNNNGFFIGLNKLAFELASAVDYTVYFLPEVCAPKVTSNSLLISHGIWFDHANYTHITYRTHKWWKLLKIAFTAPEHCVSVDTNTIGFVRSLWPEHAAKWHYLPNFYDPKQFNPVHKSNVRQKLTILFPRRAQVNRGVWLFDDIVKNISHDVEICWIGKGDQISESEIQRVCNADKRCIFSGTDFNGMSAYYQQADIVVIPTIACEGTSLSLIEALACGCAVVTTHVGGLADIALDGFNCLVADPNAQSIAECINRLINDETLRLNIASNAYKSVYGLSLQHWRERWCNILRQINWID